MSLRFFKSLHQWELLNYVVAELHSDKSSLEIQRKTGKNTVAQSYCCNRASGLSARLQDQQSMRSENDAEPVGFVNSISNVQLVPTASDADDII